MSILTKVNMQLRIIRRYAKQLRCTPDQACQKWVDQGHAKRWGDWYEKQEW